MTALAAAPRHPDHCPQADARSEAKGTGGEGDQGLAEATLLAYFCVTGVLLVMLTKPAKINSLGQLPLLFFLFQLDVPF